MLTAVARDQMWPDVVAGIAARFSKFAFVLFWHITNQWLVPWGTGSFVSLDLILGNRIHCSPRDQSLSVK